jgi:hypothetical protein
MLQGWCARLAQSLPSSIGWPARADRAELGIWLKACGARSLHSVHDEEKPFELEMSWICEESGREFQKVPAEIVAEAEQQAKAALADSDM